MALLLMFFRSPGARDQAEMQLSYTEFKQAVRQDQVERVEVEARVGGRSVPALSKGP
jgi:hypothetical protein